MGHCISIQVSPGLRDGSQKQILNHEKGERVRNPSKHKMRKRHAEESSDAETTEDEEESAIDAMAEQQKLDPNFGKAQSPINIITASASEQCATPMSNSDIQTNPLKFHYPDEVRGCTIINTGHTVQVNIPGHSKCSILINNKSYDLKQFHFHTPSEHMVDGKQFEMEMHLVHVNDDGEIAVVGFIFTTRQNYVKPNLLLRKARKTLIRQTKHLIMKSMQAAREEHPLHQDQEDEEISRQHSAELDVEWEDKNNGLMKLESNRSRGESFVPGNDFLEQFWDELPTKKTEKEVQLKKAICFDYLFECASKSFKRSIEKNEIELDLEIWEYPGSLTTPPYTEGVHWMVSKETNFINVKQLNKLSSCWGHHPNARECQDYCGRRVEVRNLASMKGYFFN